MLPVGRSASVVCVHERCDQPPICSWRPFRSRVEFKALELVWAHTVQLSSQRLQDRLLGRIEHVPVWPLCALHFCFDNV